MTKNKKTIRKKKKKTMWNGQNTKSVTYYSVTIWWTML